MLFASARLCYEPFLPRCSSLSLRCSGNYFTLFQGALHGLIIKKHQFPDLSRQPSQVYQCQPLKLQNAKGHLFNPSCSLWPIYQIEQVMINFVQELYYAFGKFSHLLQDQICQRGLLSRVPLFGNCISKSSINPIFEKIYSGF